jgi:hypothetical protein
MFGDTRICSFCDMEFSSDHLVVSKMSHEVANMRHDNIVKVIVDLASE